jgi:hypothetical protein
MTDNIDLSNIVDKKWQDKTLPEILAARPSALAGVSPKDGQLLEEAFGIQTVADLAACVPFHNAVALATLAKAAPR